MSTRSLFVSVTLLMALLFGSLVLLPHVLQRMEDVPFQGIEIMGTDAEHYYAARVREIVDGFAGVGNVYYSAPKDQPSLQPAVPEWILATIAKSTGLHPVTVFVWSKGLLAAALFLVVTMFFVQLTGFPYRSLIGVSALFFAGAALGAPWDVPRFIVDPSFSFDFLRFARPINPQWPCLWFFLTLILLTNWVRTRSERSLFFAAVCCALLLYSYVYAWTFLGAVLSVLLCWYCFLKDWKRVFALLRFGLIFGILGIPYFSHLITLSSHPWYRETAMRQGLVSSYEPLFGFWVVFFVFLSLYLCRLWRRAHPILPALALGGLIAMNQQVITGLSIVPHHYYWYFVHPLASVCTVIAGLTLLRKFCVVRFINTVGVVLLLASALAFGFVQQSRAYIRQRDAWIAHQDLAPLFAFLDDSASGAVVYTSPQHGTLRDLLPVYTSADGYSASNANLFLTPNERARMVYFFDLWLEGVTAEDAERTLTERRAELSSRLHAIYYRESLGQFSFIPNEEVEENIRWYKEYLRRPLKEKLSLYPLTAILTTPVDPVSPAWSQLLLCTSKEFEAGAYAVRHLIPAGERGSCL